MSPIHYVESVDGTRIGYRTSGTGPPLVLVHGATADHTVLSLVVPLLEPHFTVNAVDRRGRGLSGDGATYDIGLEYADVAAVVDQVARASGRRVSLYGHSYGAVCALGAAHLTDRLERLFLYEPGYGSMLQAGADLLDRVDELVASGRQDDALAHFYRAGVGMSLDEVDAMRAQPTWSARIASAPTLARELRTASALSFDAGEHRDLTVPAVLLLGGASTAGQTSVVESVHAALSQSCVEVLPGQAHAAQITAPDLVVDVLVRHSTADARA